MTPRETQRALGNRDQVLEGIERMGSSTNIHYVRLARLASSIFKDARLESFNWEPIARQVTSEDQE